MHLGPRLAKKSAHSLATKWTKSQSGASKTSESSLCAGTHSKVGGASVQCRRIFPTLPRDGHQRRQRPPTRHTPHAQDS
eukprot:805364-Pyramimonas_sp.AAC.1